LPSCKINLKFMNIFGSHPSNWPPHLPPEETFTPTFYVGALPIYGDLILSPMDGFSDLPFRTLCRELGSAMSYTEFIKVEDFLEGPEDIDRKLVYLEAERPIVFQIYGDDPDIILEAALRLRERGPDAIDVNMGCPSKSICNRGAGVGLMRTPDKIAEIFNKLSTNLDIPVTGKIRLGWDNDNRNYLEVARIVEENGGQLLAVHGRTKAQGYRGKADWDAIGEIVDAISIPVLGNGDIYNLEDIQKVKNATGCAGVMIARGAISNPWIFSHKNREEVNPSEVQTFMLRHLERCQEFYGSEKGLILFRKYAAKYLDPLRLTKEARTRLFTCCQSEDFISLLRVIFEGALCDQRFAT